MRTDCKPRFDLPYSLHDMCVDRIERRGDSLMLHFERGYVKIGDPCEQVEGSIAIEKVDFDFCFVYIFHNNGYLADFAGTKCELTDFIARYPTYSFEIVDELYGYNQLNYWGYLSLPGSVELIELCVCVYHEGNIVYEAER